VDGLVQKQYLARRLKAKLCEREPGIDAADIRKISTLHKNLRSAKLLSIAAPQIAGGLTLVVAAVRKKDWAWWIVGCVTLVIALLFYFAENGKAKSAFEETTKN